MKGNYANENKYWYKQSPRPLVGPPEGRGNTQQENAVTKLTQHWH
jgi:hypothetical protein